MAEETFIQRWQRKRAADKKALAERPPMTFGETILSWIRTFVGAVLIVMVINGIAIASFVVPTGSMERTVMTGDFLFVNKFIFGPSTPQVIPFFNIPIPFYKFPAIRDPRQGDVIVFIYPGDRDQVEANEFQYYLKRCVAVAGDSLLIRNQHVYVNGKEFTLPEEGQVDYSANFEMDASQTYPPGKNNTRANFGPVRVPKKGDIIPLSGQNYEEWRTFIAREGHKVAYDGTSVLVDGTATGSYKVQKDYCFGMGDNRDNSQDSRFWGFIPMESVVGKPIIVYWSWPMRDDYNREYSIGEKIPQIRWSRIGHLID